MSQKIKDTQQDVTLIYSVSKDPYDFSLSADKS